MKISELIKLLQEQQSHYGDMEVKVRSHQTGEMYPVDYVTLWTKTKEYYIGIEKDIIRKKNTD
jgi:hypothetical protein